MQKVTFTKFVSRLRRGVWIAALASYKIGLFLAFLVDLMLVTIAMVCYCLVIRRLPTQLQEEELLVEYQKGIDFGRKDTLEKLASLGHAFKQTPDGNVSIIPEATELASQSNQQLSS